MGNCSSLFNILLCGFYTWLHVLFNHNTLRLKDKQPYKKIDDDYYYEF